MELLNNQNTEKSTVTLTVKVTKEEFAKATDKAFAKNAKKINIAGFRKGKAPRSMIEKMYGANVFFEDAVNILYPDAYDFAVTEAKAKAIGPGSVDVKDVNDEGLTLEFVVPVMPNLTLNTYKGLEVPKEDVKKITATAIKEELDSMAKRLARTETVTRKIKKGDSVNFDFEGYVDGQKFDGGSAENFDLVIGSGQFIPGFEDALIGAKSGDDIDVSVTFPADYHSEALAGKPAVFKCKINLVKQTITPKIDDEFAKDVSEFDTLEDLKSDITEKLTVKQQDDIQKNFENGVVEALGANLEGEIPEILIEQQSNRVVQDFAQRIQMQGMQMDQYLSMNGLDNESFKKLFRPQAEAQVKTRFALELVSEKENLEVSEQEINDEYEKIAKMYNMELEQIKNAIPENGLKLDLLMNKAVLFVTENAVATKVKKAKKDEVAE